ncbi:hypothetical protein F511_38389 [Dorcoceras hygrometricum]|uniref:Uncharacterized protein n=1 Tax=Dorcoceras hygrometricum TaxID=472368 RepID=A0A2Z7DI04_9LAMI|nr:hypothetical protein F511_38389 [Dorcoceras hygrometricum]
MLRLDSCCDWLLLQLVVASAEEQENDIRTATEDDQQQLRNLLSTFDLASISGSEEQSLRTLIEVFENRGTKEERTSGEQPRVARENYLDTGSAARRLNTS